LIAINDPLEHQSLTMIHWGKHPSGKLGTPQQPGGQPGGAKASVPMVKLIGHIQSSSNKSGMHQN